MPAEHLRLRTSPFRVKDLKEVRVYQETSVGWDEALRTDNSVCSGMEVHVGGIGAHFLRISLAWDVVAGCTGGCPVRGRGGGLCTVIRCFAAVAGSEEFQA